MKNTKEIKSRNTQKLLNFTTHDPPEEPKLLTIQEDDTAIPISRRNRKLKTL